MAVFVLDRRKRPLMPCTNVRARVLLARGRARIHKRMPFTIRLVDRLVEDSVLQPVSVKVDPGSKNTGIAIVRADDSNTHHVLTLIELAHRGAAISKALLTRRSHRQFRRSKLRYRPARFQNRTRAAGWLPPSLRHRVDTTSAVPPRPKGRGFPAQAG